MSIELDPGLHVRGSTVRLPGTDLAATVTGSADPKNLMVNRPGSVPLRRRRNARHEPRIRKADQIRVVGEGAPGPAPLDKITADS